MAPGAGPSPDRTYDPNPEKDVELELMKAVSEPHPTIACWHAVAPCTRVFGKVLPPDASMPGDVVAEGINYKDA